MPKDILDIVDTAVKIGLGALISGVSTYFVTSLTFRNNTEKEFQSRKRELLENIAEELETFSNASLEYWARVVEYTRYKESHKEIPRDFKDKIEDSGKRLFQDFSNLTSAESKLMLLGLEQCEETVKEFGKCVKTMRRTPWKEDSSLTTEQAESFRLNIREKRKKFYSELRNAYNG